MAKFLIILVCVICLGVPSSLAQIYRWTDDSGRVHYTDNPGSIPPHRRASSRQLSPDTPGFTTSGSQAPAPPVAGTPSIPATSPLVDQAGQIARLRQRTQVLEQQIAAAEGARQQSIEQLNAVRDVRMNPEFGRGRRRVEELGQSLAAVERQLDALRAELQEVRAQLQELEQTQQPTALTPAARRDDVLDLQGHSQAYWQRRLETLRTRLRQAKEQRQKLLKQLAAEHQGAYGRRGKEVLQLTRELQQTEQTINDTEAALQTLRQEATRAGAPAEWLH